MVEWLTELEKNIDNTAKNSNTAALTEYLEVIASFDEAKISALSSSDPAASQHLNTIIEKLKSNSKPQPPPQPESKAEPKI